MMINIRTDPSKFGSKQFLKLIRLANHSNETIRLVMPSGRFYYFYSQAQFLRKQEQTQMLNNRYHRTRRMLPFM